MVFQCTDCQKGRQDCRTAPLHRHVDFEIEIIDEFAEARSYTRRNSFSSKSGCEKKNEYHFFLTRTAFKSSQITQTGSRSVNIIHERIQVCPWVTLKNIPANSVVAPMKCDSDSSSRCSCMKFVLWNTSRSAQQSNRFQPLSTTLYRLLGSNYNVWRAVRGRHVTSRLSVWCVTILDIVRDQRRTIMFDCRKAVKRAGQRHSRQGYHFQ